MTKIKFDFSNRITPENIQILKDKHVFVYETNESGVNSSGTARTARKNFNRPNGCGFGLTWISDEDKAVLGIPTMSWEINKPLDKKHIEFYINRSIELMSKMPDMTFLVTKIGYEAGYHSEEIAPMFQDCINLENVYLPKEFWEVLTENTELLATA